MEGDLGGGEEGMKRQQEVGGNSRGRFRSRGHKTLMRGAWGYGEVAQIVVGSGYQTDYENKEVW